MSPEHPEEDEFLEDEEGGEYGQRSIFATGWFRAVLVLLVLAVIAVIAVPLIGGWFEPTPPPRTATAPSEPSPAVAPTPAPPAATPAAPATPAPAPSTAETPSTPAAPPAPATPPPAAVVTPAPARPETPPSASSATASKPAEKAPEHVATATPAKKATRRVGPGSYWVQVGAFKESGNAESLARKLRAEGFPVEVAQVKRDVPMHVVRVGGYPDHARARAAREELQGKGHAGFITKGPAK